jgi:hypothetical protein
VGYTLSKLKVVLNVHKNKYENIENGECNRRIYGIVRANGGWDNWSIISLEECYFKDKVEAQVILSFCSVLLYL